MSSVSDLLQQVIFFNHLAIFRGLIYLKNLTTWSSKFNFFIFLGACCLSVFILCTTQTNKQRLIKIRFTHKKTLFIITLVVSNKFIYCNK